MRRLLRVWLLLLVLGVSWTAGEALAQGGGAGGETAGTGNAGAEAQPAAGGRYSLWDFIKGGGIISIPIWISSGLLLALAIENGLTLRRHVIMPVDLIEGFNRNVRERKFQEAYEAASRSDSFLGRVLTAGLSRLPLGYEAAVQHMQETGEEETMRLEQRVGYLSLIGVVAPMLGLLGTVTGMIKAFHQIALKGEAVKPGDMATGISEALVTTCEGLIVAIPAIAVYALYRNRLQRLVLEVGLVVEEMMSQFNPAMRGRSAAAGAVAAMGPARGTKGSGAASPAGQAGQGGQGGRDRPAAAPSETTPPAEQGEGGRPAEEEKPQG